MTVAMVCLLVFSIVSVDFSTFLSFIRHCDEPLIYKKLCRNFLVSEQKHNYSSLILLCFCRRPSNSMKKNGEIRQLNLINQEKEKKSIIFIQTTHRLTADLPTLLRVFKQMEQKFRLRICTSQMMK